jgi:hypothetical protein
VYFRLFFTTSFNLDAKIRGAETCYLGVMVHDAELGVFFLNLSKRDVFTNFFEKKGKRKKSDDGLGIWPRWTLGYIVVVGLDLT